MNRLGLPYKEMMHLEYSKYLAIRRIIHKLQGELDAINEQDYPEFAWSTLRAVKAMTAYHAIRHVMCNISDKLGEPIQVISPNIRSD